jgi:hypothetical protein
MNFNHNCNFDNFIKASQPQLLQIDPIIYQYCNYIDHDMSIELGDGGRSEEKRPKSQEVEVGQRRRGAMLSVQSKGINLRFIFSWLPPDLLTGWPALSKPSFINQRFGLLIMPKPSYIKPRFGG